jgi:hypothetical protein
MNVISTSHMVKLWLIVTLNFRNMFANIAFNFWSWLNEFEMRINISSTFFASQNVFFSIINVRNILLSHIVLCIRDACKRLNHNSKWYSTPILHILILWRSYCRSSHILRGRKTIISWWHKRYTWCWWKSKIRWLGHLFMCVCKRYGVTTFVVLLINIR